MSHSQCVTSESFVTAMSHCDESFATRDEASRAMRCYDSFAVSRDCDESL